MHKHAIYIDPTSIYRRKWNIVDGGGSVRFILFKFSEVFFYHNYYVYNYKNIKLKFEPEIGSLTQLVQSVTLTG